jgi:hypothetical protein
MKGGEMLKKKILLVTGALLLATFMATSLIMLVQATKNVMPFSSYNEVSLTFGGGTDANQKTSQDEEGHLLIRWGTSRDIPYSNSVVGTGRMYLETVRSITNYEVEPSSPGAVDGVAKGHGIYKVKIVITTGPNAGASLEGFAIMTWEWDFSISPATHIQSLITHIGAFEGAKLNYDNWNVRLPSGKYGVWRVGEFVLP